MIAATRFEAHLNPGSVTTDVAAFEAEIQAATAARSGAARRLHLEEAARLYTGELLPGYLDDWILPERHHRENSFLQLLGELIQPRKKRETSTRRFTGPGEEWLSIRWMRTGTGS